MGPVSSFMGNIVGVFLVTYHFQECDGVQFCGHPEDLIFWLVINYHLNRREGLRTGEERMQRRMENAHLV